MLSLMLMPPPPSTGRQGVEGMGWDGMGWDGMEGKPARDYSTGTVSLSNSTRPDPRSQVPSITTNLPEAMQRIPHRTASHTISRSHMVTAGHFQGAASSSLSHPQDVGPGHGGERGEEASILPFYAIMEQQRSDDPVQADSEIEGALAPWSSLRA